MRRAGGKAAGPNARATDRGAIVAVPDLEKVRADLEEAEKVADTTLKAYRALLRPRSSDRRIGRLPS